MRRKPRPPVRAVVAFVATFVTTAALLEFQGKDWIATELPYLLSSATMVALSTYRAHSGTGNTGADDSSPCSDR